MRSTRSTNVTSPPHERSAGPGLARWALLGLYSALFLNGILLAVLGRDFAREALSLLPGPGLCVFHVFTGWECPGCGMTRAFLALGRGAIAEAIRLNALAPALFGGGLLWLARPGVRPIPARIGALLLLAVVGYGIWRNG
jgi:hypothetical protein